MLDQSLAKIGGKGLFIKELEEAMLDGRADLAVHSAKDVPYVCPPEFTLAAIGLREDPRDALVSRDNKSLSELPEGSVVGTSSLRRMMQVVQNRPDLKCEPLRGNVQTRLAKLKEGKFDAIVLAAAGLHRLNLHSVITEYLDNFLPAVGQGALAIECRKDDQKIIDLLKPLHEPLVSVCVEAERAMNAKLKGSCSVPIAGFATLKNEIISLRGKVGLPDGTRIIEAYASGSIHEPIEVGHAVAQSLLSQGALEIFKACE